MHGVCIPSPVDPITAVTIGPSSAYRPFTPGICFCEPGFAGEQCGGGQSPNPASVAWNAIGTTILLFGVLFVYRKRKESESDFDDDHITPSDFTVFVDNIPKLRLDSSLEQTNDTKALYEHFEQIGPVHFIAPATNDNFLLLMQYQRKILIDRIRMLCEIEDYNRAKKAAGLSGTAFQSSTTVSLDPSEIEIDYKPWEEFMFEGAPRFASFEFFAALVISTPITSLLCCKKQTLVQFLSYTDWRIKRMKQRLSTYEYSRAFVTFTYADLKWVAIKAFKNVKLPHQKTNEAELDDEDENDIGIPIRSASGRSRFSPGSTNPHPKPDTSPSKTDNHHVISGLDEPDVQRLLFRGRKLKVSAAPEPEEVIWGSLDTEFNQQLWHWLGSTMFACLLAVALYFAALYLTCLLYTSDAADE